MWSTYLLCIFKIDGGVKHLNSLLDFQLTGILTNFLISPSILKVKKWKTTFWKSQGTETTSFWCKMFYCDATKIHFRNNSAWSSFNSCVYWDTLYFIYATILSSLYTSTVYTHVTHRLFFAFSTHAKLQLLIKMRCPLPFFFFGYKFCIMV